MKTFMYVILYLFFNSHLYTDSEMRAIYMRSVRSPLTSTKYRMAREKHNNMNIFSQVLTTEVTIEDFPSRFEMLSY